MTPSIRVHTAQNVTIEYPVASIGERIVATIIDWLILAAWGGLVAAVVFNVSAIPDEIQVWIMGILVGLPVLFYRLVSEIFLDGQSIGKKSQKLRVVRLDGTAPRVGDYLLRWLLRIVDNFFYGLVGIIAIAASGKGQRVGDMAAGTSVISLKPVTQPLLDVASLATPADYQPVFPQAANLSDQDVALLRQLVTRSIQNQNRELLHETALKIKALLYVQADDLDDEAFLRTVLRDHAHLLSEVSPG